MARLTFDGNWRVFVVDTVVDIAAPTVAEIDAGTEITSFIPKNGLAVSNAPNMVDTGDLSTQYDSEVMGTYKVNASLTILLDDTTDTASDEFQTHGSASHLVILPYKGTGDVAAADVVHVLPMETGKAVPNGTAANERQTADVPIAVTDEPSFNGSVAA